MKKVKYFEKFWLFIKDVRETIKNEAKGQKGGWFNILLDTLGTKLSGNFLSGKV